MTRSATPLKADPRRVPSIRSAGTLRYISSLPAHRRRLGAIILFLTKGQREQNSNEYGYNSHNNNRLDRYCQFSPFSHSPHTVSLRVGFGPLLWLNILEYIILDSTSTVRDL